MEILNIHGYGGNPKNAALKENGCINIIASEINYDESSPEIISGMLKQL